MVQEHQREQAARLRLRRGERELAGEPDGLAGEVRAARVARRVDEVQHAQDDGEVAGPVEPPPAQRPLGPADALRHRRLRHEEGVGDLTGGEPADSAQGQRHLRCGRQVGVAAAEEEDERVVARLGVGGRQWLRGRRLLATGPRGLAAPGVDETPGGHRRQPRARVPRRVLGPHPQRLDQRLLQRVLGGVEVLATADQAREDARDEGAQRALVQRSRRLLDHGAQSSAGASDMTSRMSIHS